MNRGDVILYLMRRLAYQSYLEIGCLGDDTFRRIDARHKVGVDPNSGGTHRMTSDEFFAQNTDRFDLVFVDGNHAAPQVGRDLENALAVLNPGGCVVLHDTVPITRDMTGRYNGQSYWTGDVWWTVALLGRRDDLDFATIPDEWGCSVVFQRPRSFTPRLDLLENAAGSERVPTWDDFTANERELLNQMTWAEMRDWIG